MRTARRHQQALRALVLTMAGGWFVVAFWDGMTKNWADIEVHAHDPRLEAVVWEGCSNELAVARAAEVVKKLPRWKVVGLDITNGTLHATHATQWWGFIDDVHLTLAAIGPDTRITAHSQSRIGRGDLGQNARNLRELAHALRQVR